MNLKFSTTVFFAALLLNAFAQPEQQDGITHEQAVEFINKKLGKDVMVELAAKNRQIVINFYKGSVIYKIDKIYLQTIDSNKVSYSNDEKALILRCLDEKELQGKLKKFKDGCVERQIVEKDIIGHYGRCNIEMAYDKKKVESLRKAFIHLIKLEQDEEYKSSVPFE